MSRWGAERGAHGNVTHRHNTMAERSSRMPETRPRSRNHHLPAMRRRPRLQRVTTAQQRRGRPHRAPRARRRRHPREHPHSLPTLQPIARRTTGNAQTDPHVKGLVTGKTGKTQNRRSGMPPDFWGTSHPTSVRKKHDGAPAPLLGGNRGRGRGRAVAATPARRQSKHGQGSSGDSKDRASIHHAIRIHHNARHRQG